MLSGCKVWMWLRRFTFIAFIPYTQRAHKIQTTGNHPKDRIHYSKHGESLKSRTVSFVSKTWHQIHVLSKETYCDIGEGLEASPWKLYDRYHMRPAYQSQVYMQPKTIASFEMVQIDIGAITPRSRLCFCNWYCEAVCIGQVNPLLTYSTQEAWF